MGWLVSPAVDLGLVLGPGCVAAAVALAFSVGAPAPPWLWVLGVLAVDVAHVWATLYRVYLVPGEVARRPLLYVGGPLGVAVGLGSLMVAAPHQFWRVLAYLAAFHFVRQVVGIGALYRARAGLSTRSPAARLERAALYAVTLGPLVWWGARLPRSFDWFVPGDFLALPASIGSWVLPVVLVVLGAHLWVRRTEGPPGPRDLWLGSSAAAWGVGIVLTNGDAAFTLTNTLAHGVPYFVLVGRVWQQRRGGAWPRPGPGWGRAAAAAGAMLAPLLVLAVLEETLWDAFVWREWAVGPEPSEGVAAVATVLLAVPQVTHYLLDGYIWRLSPRENPGLGVLLVGR